MEKRKSVMKWLALSAAVLVCGLFAPEAKAVDFEFHGYVENTSVLRDTNGSQNSIMDQVELVQQKTTLKFDVDVYLRKEMGPFALDKVHLTYRGAYDAIFDLRDDEYGAIADKRGNKRWDYGLDDLKWENDLREITLDITYRGAAGSGFFRPGRQMVSWGEVSALTIFDRINPADISAFTSLIPDELKTPIYMGRLNYSIPPQPSFNLNFDLLVIPDVRPVQFASFDSSAQAPFIKNSGASALILGANAGTLQVYDKVPSHRWEYAAKMTMDIGANLSMSVIYESLMNDAFYTAVPDFAGGLALIHNWQEVYGGAFNYYISPPFDIVMVGEVGWVNNKGEQLDDQWYLPRELRTRVGDQFLVGLGMSKNMWMRWLCPTKMVSHSLEFYWWNDKGGRAFSGGVLAAPNVDTRTQLFYRMGLTYLHGKIEPSFSVVYDTNRYFSVSPSCNFVLSKNWKIQLSGRTFFGNRHTEASGDMWQPDSLVGGNWTEITAMSNANGPIAQKKDATDQLQLKVVFQW